MPRRLLLVTVLVVAVAWLGFRAVQAFDQDRHAAEAAAVLAAPDVVTHRLLPVAAGQVSPPAGQVSPPAGQVSPPAGQVSPAPRDGGAPEWEGSSAAGGVPEPVHSPGASGRLAYRPGTWLSVVDLRGLEPIAGHDRYLVFVRNWAGWTLAGAARPAADGTAQVRSGAEPRPPTIYEVVVTWGVDDATSVPHGEPVLHWFDGSLGPPRAVPFDFARGT